MEWVIGVVFVIAMVVAAKGVKAPDNAAQVVRLHNGETDMPRGNFVVALLLLGAVAVIGIGMLGAGSTKGSQGNNTPSVNTNNTQINIASEVRNTVIASDGARLCEDPTTLIYTTAACQ